MVGRFYSGIVEERRVVVFVRSLFRFISDGGLEVGLGGFY